MEYSPENNFIEIASGKRETKSNIVDSLIGAIPNTGKTLDDYRSERIERYAGIHHS